MIDKNSIRRDIEGFQAQLDKIFHRANEDPTYRDLSHLKDAISDNPRFFPEDRRADLAEILFSLLDIIYENIDSTPGSEAILNPLAPSPSSDFIPECDMFMRIVMPLSWAISRSWPWSELARATDFYTAGFNPQQTTLIKEILFFIFDLFPPIPEFAQSVAEIKDYWEALANHPEEFHPESEDDKSKLLPILLSAAKQHNIF